VFHHDHRCAVFPRDLAWKSRYGIVNKTENTNSTTTLALHREREERERERERPQQLNHHPGLVLVSKKYTQGGHNRGRVYGTGEVRAALI